MKTKIHTLPVEKDFILIGIVSHLSIYKLSWLLNTELNAKFQQAESVEIKDKNADEPIKFAVFEFEDPDGSSFVLFSNRNEKAILLKSIKHIDYVIKLEGVTSIRSKEEYIEKLKKINNILTVFEISPEQLKSKEWELFS